MGDEVRTVLLHACATSHRTRILVRHLALQTVLSAQQDQAAEVERGDELEHMKHVSLQQGVFHFVLRTTSQMIHTMFAPFPTLPLAVYKGHSTLKPVRTSMADVRSGVHDDSTSSKLTW